MAEYCDEIERIPYDLELSRIVGFLKREEAKRVLIQAPDGLKQYLPILVGCLRSAHDADYIIYGENLYGACFLGVYDEHVEEVDAIIHIGHTPYPMELAGGHTTDRRSNILYIPAFSRVELSPSTMEQLALELSRLRVSSVGVVASVQHVPEARRVSSYLTREGFRAVVPRGIPMYFLDGQVIGCDYRVASRISRDVESFVYVGGGIFHPLGLYLSTLKPVIKADPYRDEISDLTKLGERTLRVRYMRVSEAMNAKRWGIIAGVEAGQYRPWIISRLKSLIFRKGGDYRLIVARYTGADLISNIDTDWYEAFVITSCPRIPIDDVRDYHKPVLTPGEAFMALEGDLSKYRFPW